MKSINQNELLKCSKAITINLSSKKVWEVLSDIDNWAIWQTDINNSKLNGELKPTNTFSWNSGGANILSTLQIVDPNKELSWTGKSLGIRAIHTWKLSEQNGRTTIFVYESMEGFLVGLFKKTFNKKLNSGMQKWLDLLKIECEKLN